MRRNESNYQFNTIQAGILLFSLASKTLHSIVIYIFQGNYTNKLLNFFIIIVVLPSTSYADNIKTKLENNSIVINALKTDNSLRLVLSPKGDSKIPLDPGISIESVDDNKIDWTPSLPHRFSEVEGYMETPVKIMLNFNGGFESATTLRITYAFCPSPDVCEFENIDLNVQP